MNPASVARAAAIAVALLAPTAALAAPPVAGRGYGLPVRTIEGLDDVRAALVEDSGELTCALGPAGVVRVGADGTRSTVLARWPLGQVGEAVALTRLLDGTLVVADAALGGLAFVKDGAAPRTVRLAVEGRAIRPVGLATLGERLYIADGSVPRILECGANGTIEAIIPVNAPESSAALEPSLGGIAAGNGVVMVTDAANNRVVAFSAADRTEIAASGDRGAFPGMWQSPAGIDFDGVGFLVTDLLNHRIVRVDASGKTLDDWGFHAVRPREGNGKIHYPTVTHASPDGQTVAVAEPFERRVQLFAGNPPPDPEALRKTALPAFDGVASHFSTEIAVDGQTLAVFEPESASVLVFDLRNEPPIHVTTLGGPGNRGGLLGQVSTLCVDEARNRIHAFDPLRRRIVSFALVRDGTAPHYDPFMGRLVREVPMEPIERFVVERNVDGAPRVLPIDVRPLPSGGFLMLDACGPRFIELDADFAPVAGFACNGADRKLVLPTQFAVVGDEAWTVDTADRSIKRYAIAGGTLRGTVPLDGLKRPYGIERVPGGAGDAPRLLVTDAGGDAIVAFDVSGNEPRLVGRGGGNGIKPAELWEPAGIAWCPATKRAFVADHGNHRIQSFDGDAAWASSFGIGRAYVRPKDPQATGPVPAQGSVPSAEGAADTRAQFPAAAKGADGWWTVPSADGRWLVSWKFDADLPPLRDPFGIDVRVRPAKGGAAFVGTLRPDAAMPQHGHGMNVAPTVKRTGEGTFRVEGMLFHMPGYWELYFDLGSAGTLERTQGSVTLE